MDSTKIVPLPFPEPESKKYKVICNCDCDNTNLSSYAKLKAILPQEYEYRVCSYKEYEQGFITTLRLPINNVLEATEWRKQFEEVSKTTLRLAKTYPHSGLKNTYKVDLRCQHQVRHRKDAKKVPRASSKHTDCTAAMTIVVKRSDMKKPRTSDGHLFQFPMIVNLRFTHNHPINTADNLKFRDVSDHVKKKFLEMFEAGHSPASALEIHKYDLQMEFKNNFIFTNNDRALVPDLQWCYRLHHAITKKSERQNDVSLQRNLENLVEDLNSERGTIIKMNVTSDNNIVLAVCTPLMKRITLRVRQSAEMIFVDSSGNMSHHNVRLFVLMTQSYCGGLPVGCLIMSNDSENTIKSSLELYKSLLPEEAFLGRGAMGPMVFMTDDCDSERSALEMVFPEAKLGLCVLHMIRAAWRWIWDAKNCIALNDRQYLFNAFKDMMCANNPNVLDAKYQAISYDYRIAEYKSFISYVGKIYERKGMWAVCFKTELLMFGNSISNFCEAAVRIAKDIMPIKLKAFNALQLVDLIVSRMDGFFEERMLDVASNGLVNMCSKYLPPSKRGINLDDVEQDTQNYNVYRVPSETKKETFYYVNTDMGLCTCHIGLMGWQCKHQGAVVQKFKVETNITPVLSPEMRYELYTVATGKGDVSKEWFTLLRRDSRSNSEMSVDHDYRISSEHQDGVSSPSNRNSSPSSPVSSLSSPQPCEQSVAVQNSEISDVKWKFISYCSSLVTKLEKDPEKFLPALKTFLENGNNLQSDSDVISALNTFGKYSAVLNVIHVGMHSDAAANGKVPIPRYQAAQNSSSPQNFSSVYKKNNRMVQKRAAVSDLKKKDLPPRKKRAAPHDLSESISRNEELEENDTEL